MKKQIYFIILLLTCRICDAQNLVPNGDFESYTSCPTGLGQLDFALPWLNPTDGTPDYFNQCAPVSSLISVPINRYGFQTAHSGVGYCGIVCGQDVAFTENYREYIEVPLTSTLVANTCYHYEFYYSLANECIYTSDVIGIYFSDLAILGIPNYDPLPFIPQVSINLGLVTDTLNWIQVSGNYTASGGENYLIIGNFNDYLQTNLVLINSSGLYPYSYFYIDDIVIDNCSTGIEDQSNNNGDGFSIFPNPFSDKIFITAKRDEPVEVNLYDGIGKKIFNQSFTNSITINTEQLSKGIYIYEVRNEKGVINKGKVVKD